MAANGIPGVEPLGPSHETLRFVIGIVTYLLVLAGLVVYLAWKLPRDQEGPGQPTDDESDQEAGDEGA